jgi:5'-nucleotidase / UDP-sugar diphosphatase
MKDYKFVVFLLIIVLGVSGFLIYKSVDMNELLYNIGVYDKKITIVNTADIHGHIIYEKDSGAYYTFDEPKIVLGMAKINSFVSKMKAKDKNLLFVDSGDLFHGTNEANINNGQGVVDIAKLMGYTSMTVGNHDFNFGIDRLLEIRDNINFPMLSANVFLNDKLLFKEYMIVEVNGIKLGLFGLTTEVSLSHLNTRDLKGIKITNPVIEAKNVVEKLKGKCDSIILVSHLGTTQDREIMRQVKGIDVIFCGHSHFIKRKPEIINGINLVAPGSYTNFVGVARLYFNKNKLKKFDWKLVTPEKENADNSEINKIALTYQKAAFENGKEIIGKAKCNFDGYRSHVRTGETNLGNLITDAMCEEAAADIAIVNGGVIRESLPEGEITVYKVGKVIPFINSLVTIEMSGDLIYQAIERGLRPYPNPSNGAFLHVSSGLSYTFDASKIAGKRLVSVTFNGKPLDKNKIYKVATNDYLFNGGDNYTEFIDTKILSYGDLLKTVLANYIKRHKEVKEEKENRINVINVRYK